MKGSSSRTLEQLPCPSGSNAAILKDGRPGALVVDARGRRTEIAACPLSRLELDEVGEHDAARVVGPPPQFVGEK